MTTVVTEYSKVKKVIFSFSGMFLLGIGIVVLAMATASLLNSWHPFSEGTIKKFEYLGYAGWCATLGIRGWDIQTWDGSTFPEKLNSWLAQAFSFIGIFSFVLARELIPVA